METLSKDLLPELECPVCLEYMMPPITLCANGHNICNNCKPKLHNCPTCKAHFLNVRNFGLESIAKKLRYPCRYQEVGCQETSLLDDVRNHLLGCPHVPYKCPFAIVEECIWEGNVLDIKTHIENVHTDPCDSAEASGKHVTSLPNMKTNCTWYQAVFALDEVFFRYTKTTEDLLYIVIFHVGERNHARNYRYELTCHTTDGTGRISASNVTPSYRDGVNEIIDNDDCLVLKYGFVRKCIDPNNKMRFEEVITRFST